MQSFTTDKDFPDLIKFLHSSLKIVSFVVDPLFGVFPIGSGGSVFVFVLLCITLCPF